MFDTFWRFAAERHQVYLRRLAAAPPPWSNDPILTGYRFTNVYRASDRVSQYLIGHVIYDGENRSAVDTVFRTLLFKIFNRVDTWQMLEGELGAVSVDSFDTDGAVAVLDAALARRQRVYSGAYIVPPFPGSAGIPKHHGHLRLLASAHRDGDLGALTEATGLRELYERLAAWPGFGPFLAYQFAIDLNYAPLFSFDENTFVVAGPGARDGLYKCFTNLHDHAPEAVIRRVWERQGEEFAARGLTFDGLWGRPMSLIDVQNVFCEISKYARVAHPDVRGPSGRLRIKQRFRPAGPLPTPVFPPEWNVSPTTVGSARDVVQCAGGQISDDETAAVAAYLPPDPIAGEQRVLPLGV